MTKPISLAVALLAVAPACVTAVDAAAEVPEYGYLFAHFYGNGESGLHLAWSADGLEWHLLNNGKSYLQPRVGESRLMRDPSLVMGPDGMFHMVWTTAWAGKTIGYASSADLLNWSEQRAIAVMAHEPDAVNCWAPEIMWDPTQECYLILWSTTIPGKFPETALSNRRPSRNHRIYSTTTIDFETFTPTRLHYDGGFNVIDAVLAQGDGEWLMVVKDEELAPKTQKNIRLLRAATPYGPFSAPSAPISQNEWSEGPYIIRVGDAWHVYYDQHMVDEYGLVRSYDLVNWESMDDQTRFPKDANHGSFVRVPGAVIARLIEATPKAELSLEAAHSHADPNSLQRKLDQLAAHGGGTLNIAAGRHPVHAVQLPANVTLLFAENAVLELQLPPSSGPVLHPVFLLNAQQVDRIQIRGGRFIAAGGGIARFTDSRRIEMTGIAGTGLRGIQVERCSEVVIQHIDVSARELPPYFVSDSSYIRLTDVASTTTSNEPIVALHNVRDGSVNESVARPGNRTFVLIQGSASRSIRMWQNDLSAASVPWVIGPDADANCLILTD